MIKKHFKDYMGNRKIAIHCLMAIAFFLFLIFSFHFFKIMVLGQSHGVNLRDELENVEIFMMLVVVLLQWMQRIILYLQY